MSVSVVIIYCHHVPSDNTSRCPSVSSLRHSAINVIITSHCPSVSSLRHSARQCRHDATVSVVIHCHHAPSDNISRHPSVSLLYTVTTSLLTTRHSHIVRQCRHCISVSSVSSVRYPWSLHHNVIVLSMRHSVRQYSVFVFVVFVLSVCLSVCLSISLLAC